MLFRKNRAVHGGRKYAKADTKKKLIPKQVKNLKR
jgi:hypothetical protein